MNQLIENPKKSKIQPTIQKLYAMKTFHFSIDTHVCTNNFEKFVTSYWKS